MELDKNIRLNIRVAIVGLKPEEVCKYLEQIFKESTFVATQKVAKQIQPPHHAGC